MKSCAHVKSNENPQLDLKSKLRPCGLSLSYGLCFCSPIHRMQSKEISGIRVRAVPVISLNFRKSHYEDVVGAPKRKILLQYFINWADHFTTPFF
ncbi:hypothetical protein BgiBS90_004273 [Biomphalaria glabrata]|nr:hypothetical protein BgiBS90_004273 [Biomphalaria glabrata]